MTTGFVVHCETLAIWWLSTPSHLLNIDVVLPTFEAHGIEVNTVLSDNGREFCGRMGRHPYELFLQLEGIEHRKTRVKCRNPTGSSSASIARCSTSTSVSKAAAVGVSESRFGFDLQRRWTTFCDSWSAC
jgi:hypothetical protein